MQEEWSYSFTWRPTRDGKKTVEGAGFPTMEVAHVRMNRARLAFGYRPRHFWEWWRWGESVPKFEGKLAEEA